MNRTKECSVLIIGSLLWDSETDRRTYWRAARLDVGARIPVRAPIYYGRKSESRGNTFTMAFRPGGEPSGQAVLVPCANKIKTTDKLIEEANALWQAEDANATPGCLHKSWGCVGALFRRGTTNTQLAVDWTDHFRKRTRCVSIVDTDGLLGIAWPNGLDGQPADFDVILATATKPATESPTAQAVADAWVAECKGNENYFFNNVRHGIRTPEDIEIWRRIEKQSPPWLKTALYEEAIEILRAESKPRALQ